MLPTEQLSFSIPLPISPGRNDFSPALALSYNSGGGNSPYGLGWSIGYPMIQRQTDKILPRYQDGYHARPEGKDRGDVFMLTGMEDLVPHLDRDGGEWKVREREDGDVNIKTFRPRIEGGFDRIEQISFQNEVYWKLTSRDNITTFFGYRPEARLSDPDHPEKIFAWLPEFSYDDKGNWILYEYKAENLENVANDLHERNRHNGNARFTNRYLKRVKYGNRLPYYATQAYQPIFPGADEAYFFELLMDYGEHFDPNEADSIPAFEEIQSWLARPDAFSSYRSGFEIRTYRRCHRILMFHHFPEEQKF